MMDSMRISGWGDELDHERVGVPELGLGDVLIAVEATGVGQTVCNVVNGDVTDDNGQLPRIPGHEIVGTIQKTGEAVSGLGIGDRVTAYMYLTCNRCRYCLDGRDPLCVNLDGLVGTHMDGGYAEYVRLPAENIVSIPDGIDPVLATAIPDAIGTPFHVVNRRLEVELGDSVAILGAGGGVGIHLLQLVTHAGGSVTAVDKVEQKLDRCVELGAERVIDTSVESLDDVTDEFDTVVDFTGSMKLLKASLDRLAPSGRLVNLTAFPDRTMEVSPQHQVRRELDVVGSRYCSRYELLRAAELVADGVVTPVVTEEAALEDVNDLHRRIADDQVIGRAAVRP